MTSKLWSEDEQTVEEVGISVPAWIESDITPYDVAAIIEGGCASGAYMPAVRYYDAAQTMGRHGDAVLDYIEEHEGVLPSVAGQSWSGIACLFLSLAVEIWAYRVEAELADAIGVED